MLQALIKRGKVTPEEVPAPVVSNGGVLIKVVSSCISAGTELSGVQSSGKSLIRRALEQPENVRKVLNMARSEGIAQTLAKARVKLKAGSPTGYSLAGIVLAVGEGVGNIKHRDHVTAAGAGIANHAEYVDVPENLVVKIPAGVNFVDASTVTLGAIAIHGVRRADLKLGEFCVVFGTGILGLLAIQILKLSGVRIIAVDLDEKRLAIARDLGAEFTIYPSAENPIKAVENITGGYGADTVLFTAATTNSEPLSQAFAMCRRKGRVVMVGVADMQINREDMYAKELDLLMSTSYGPGRYDRNYEEKGYDYPYTYIRWTENRNMLEYLRLIQNKGIRLDKLISKIYPINQVTEAFESLKDFANRPLMVILDYGKFDSDKLPVYTQERKVYINKNTVRRDRVNIVLVGAGNFANGMHLPNISKLSKKYNLYAVVNRTGHKAKAAAEQYGARLATTDIDDVLRDENVDIVLIATRHDSHAGLTLKALEAGKHVFVEKPLCTTKEELDAIMEFYNSKFKIQNSKLPLLMVGFNRRFSRYAKEIKRHTDGRINPLFIHYRMNAGYIPLDHWVHESGGRIIGEACHIIDFMTFFTSCPIESVCYEALRPANEKFSDADNRSLILKYQDGSVATIEYFAVGSKEFPKEYMEVHFDEKTIVLDDYKSLKGFGMKIAEIKTPVSEKGHLEELKRLYETLRGNTNNWPIEFWDMIQTTEISIEVAR